MVPKLRCIEPQCICIWWLLDTCMLEKLAYLTLNPKTLFAMNTKLHMYRAKVTCKPYKTQVRIKVSDTYK